MAIVFGSPEAKRILELIKKEPGEIKRDIAALKERIQENRTYREELEQTIASLDREVGELESELKGLYEKEELAKKYSMF